MAKSTSKKKVTAANLGLRTKAPRYLAIAGFAAILWLGATDSTLAEDVDVLAISHDFVSLPRTLIDVSPVPQPSNGGGKLEVAESLGRIMTEELIASLKRELPTAKVVALADVPVESEELVLEARFSRLVPGSRAKRFWVGFGAGKSVTEVSGVVRERASGRVMARFTHARLSWCCGFGSNDHEIRTNLTNAANDIAAVVAGHLHETQSYSWLDSEHDATSHTATPAATTQKGLLKVDASREHAEVSIDGNLLGTTPLEIKLAPGPHHVVLKKHGFQDWTREVEVLEGGKQALWADLEEAPPPQVEENRDRDKN